MSATREDNRTYTVQFRYVDILTGQSKTYKKRGFPSLSAAKKHEASKRLELATNTGAEYTWNELCDIFLESKKGKIKDRTYINYKNMFTSQIYGIFGSMKAKNINAFVVEAWQKELLAKGFKNAYLNKLQQTVSSIMNFAVARTIMPINPLKVVGFIKNVNEPKKEMAYWTYEDYCKFQSVISDEETKLIFEILYFTGIRIGEFQALTWSDFRERDELFHVHSNFDYKAQKITQTTKTGENRYVDLTDSILAALIERKNEFKKYSNFNNAWYIFGGIKPFPRKTIENRKNQYIELYNESHEDKIPYIRLHDLRHSHVSLLINNEVDVFIIADRLGHSKEMVENVYGHLFPQKRKTVKNVLNNLK